MGPCQFSVNVKRNLPVSIIRRSIGNESTELTSSARTWCEELSRVREDQKKMSLARNALDSFGFWAKNPNTVGFLASSCKDELAEKVNLAKNECESVISNLTSKSLDQIEKQIVRFKELQDQVEARLATRQQVEDLIYDIEIDSSRGRFSKKDSDGFSGVVALYRKKNLKDVDFSLELKLLKEWQARAIVEKKKRDYLKEWRRRAREMKKGEQTSEPIPVSAPDEPKSTPNTVESKPSVHSEL
jgi:hypothetical protein